MIEFEETEKIKKYENEVVIKIDGISFSTSINELESEECTFDITSKYIDIPQRLHIDYDNSQTGKNFYLTVTKEGDLEYQENVLIHSLQDLINTEEFKDIVHFLQEDISAQLYYKIVEEVKSGDNSTLIELIENLDITKVSSMLLEDNLTNEEYRKTLLDYCILDIKECNDLTMLTEIILNQH